MKLYATVSSERAKKGQGGNKYITVSFMVGSAKQSEVIERLTLTPAIDGGYDIFYAKGDGEPCYLLRHYPEPKGKQQKGEVCEGCGEPIIDSQSRCKNRHATCI